MLVIKLERRLGGYMKSGGQAEKLADPIREMMRLLLKQKLSSKDDRLRISNAIGKSLRTLESFMYEGKGGFDTAIAALIVAYDMNENNLKELMENVKAALKRDNPKIEADRLWYGLEAQGYTDKEKANWARVMGAVKKLELRLEYDRKKNSEP